MKNSSFPRCLSAGFQVGDTTPTHVLTSDSRDLQSQVKALVGEYSVWRPLQPGPSVTEGVMGLPLSAGAGVVWKWETEQCGGSHSCI